MTDHRPDHPAKPTPADQTGENEGTIKRPQQNAQKNLPRGSEAETHACK